MGSGGASLDPVSAAVGAIGDVTSSFVNRKSQEEADDRNWRHTVQMWNMNNEYNSPVNQMKRYEEAGLNPNLMFGQISAGNSTQPSVPQSGAARFSLDLSRYLFRKEKQKSDEELDYIATQNRILKLKEEALAHDLAFYKNMNIPTKSPALTQMIALGHYKLINNPISLWLAKRAEEWAYNETNKELEHRAHDAIYDDEIPASSFHSGHLNIYGR